MKPTKFRGQNCTYAENQPECEPLPACKLTDGKVISCWKISFWELVKLLWGRRVWVTSLAFDGPLQPLWVQVDTPFSEVTDQDLDAIERDKNDV